jgi:hypothetical protein
MAREAVSTHSEWIAYYLDRYRAGDVENAFHSLAELEHEALPELIALYRATSDTDLRLFLLKVIIEHRQHSIIPLLAEALHAPEKSIWRQALDGLVILASPAALEALHAARSRAFSKPRDAEDFRSWIDEAIEQTEEGMQGRTVKS